MLGKPGLHRIAIQTVSFHNWASNCKIKPPRFIVLHNKSRINLSGAQVSKTNLFRIHVGHGIWGCNIGWSVVRFRVRGKALPWLLFVSQIKN